MLLEAEPTHLRFSYGQYGKPALRQEFGAGGLRFNLSHSNGQALYAVSLGREVGVDIEYIRRDVACEEIAERFFSVNEIRVLHSLPLEGKTKAFFNCWTRKKAYIKARGEGLSIPLDQFDVSLEPDSPVALLSSREHPQEILRWSLHVPDIGPDYAAALVVDGHNLRLKCRDWSRLA